LARCWSCLYWRNHCNKFYSPQQGITMWWLYQLRACAYPKTANFPAACAGMRTCAVRTNMQHGHANFAFIESVAFNYLRDSASPACVSSASSRPRQSGTRGEKKRGCELEVCVQGYGWLKPTLLGYLSSPARMSCASGLRRRR